LSASDEVPDVGIEGDGYGHVEKFEQRTLNTEL
jgi:hypothetical protein